MKMVKEQQNTKTRKVGAKINQIHTFDYLRVTIKHTGNHEGLAENQLHRGTFIIRRNKMLENV